MNFNKGEKKLSVLFFSESLITKVTVIGMSLITFITELSELITLCTFRSHLSTPDRNQYFTDGGVLLKAQ